MYVADKNSMNLSLTQSHLCRLLTIAEKTQQIQNNLCLYCEDKEHKTAVCTVKSSMQLQFKQTSFNSLQSEKLKLKNEQSLY